VNDSVEPSIQAIDGVEKWINGAQEVDPDDELMAPIWQDLLVDLLDNESVDEVVIDTLRKIKSHELKALLRIHRLSPFFSARRVDPSVAKDMLEKGLLHRKIATWFPYCIGLLCFGVMIAIVTPNIYLRDSNIHPNMLLVWKDMAGLIGAIIAICMLPLFLLFWMRSSFSIFHLVPSWIGTEIARRAERVQNSAVN
jgi:hypothetical protein